ncbi:hypothetical protein [Falsiporphyromonas endometrii]|uniref:Transposase n=1 Tax=Falsiporphyromonas endometrii TaxID=1387297 RepID=A0ABV9K6D5_9PORP
MKYIGIDTGKRSSTVAFSSENGSPVREYENSPKGIHKIISALSSDAVCVMEATDNLFIRFLNLGELRHL